jgi:hypothetical protein
MPILNLAAGSYKRLARYQLTGKAFRRRLKSACGIGLTGAGSALEQGRTTMKTLVYSITLLLCLGLVAGFAAAKESKVTLEQVPAAVKAAIEKELQGAAIKEIEQETEGDKTVYEVEYMKDGKEVEFCVTPDGVITQEDDDDDDGKECSKDDDDDDDDDKGCGKKAGKDGDKKDGKCCGKHNK